MNQHLNGGYPGCSNNMTDDAGRCSHMWDQMSGSCRAFPCCYECTEDSQEDCAFRCPYVVARQ